VPHAMPPPSGRHRQRWASIAVPPRETQATGLGSIPPVTISPKLLSGEASARERRACGCETFRSQPRGASQHVDEERPMPQSEEKKVQRQRGSTWDGVAAVLGQLAGFDVSKKREEVRVRLRRPCAFSFSIHPSSGAGPSHGALIFGSPEYRIFLEVGKLRFGEESIREVDRVSMPLCPRRHQKEISVHRSSSGIFLEGSS
jgi:hypothetical protein